MLLPRLSLYSIWYYIPRCCSVTVTISWQISSAPRSFETTTVWLCDPRERLKIPSHLNILLLCSCETNALNDWKAAVLLEHTLSRATAAKCLKSFWMNISLWLLKKAGTGSEYRYVDNKWNKWFSGKIKYNFLSFFCCWDFQFVFVFTRLFSFLTAASEHIFVAGRVLCMHRRNLSVWIQHLSHQLTHNGSNYSTAALLKYCITD